jgi:hydroxymethylglutaryl-CoA reductase
MAIEESSVVAAASKAAKYWFNRGGFHVEVVNTLKVGQIHFKWMGNDSKLLEKFITQRTSYFLQAVAPIVEKMEKRGGGVKSLELKDMTDEIPHYYQLVLKFDTVDAMGANFINSVLEAIAEELARDIKVTELLPENQREVLVIMSILSNYTPECLVKVFVESPIEQLADNSLGMEPELFVEKFITACEIARVDPYRATTHNKGIFNGIDAVVIATGNDFRAIEACAHTYACRDGQYRSLSKAYITDEGKFHFELELPLAVGTVGGLTALHPLAKLALELLGNPGAIELMGIIATVGLAQNFAAVRSLVTSGIQKGHMKMHLMNIMNQLEAQENERAQIQAAFTSQVVSYSAVRDYLMEMRSSCSVQ